MSLINKMLQDLESRKNAQADTASKKSVYEDLKPVKASGFRAPPNKRMSVILLALAVVGGGAYAWMQWGEQLLSYESAAVKTRPVAAHKAAPKPAPAPAPAPVAVVAATPVPAVKADPAQPTVPATEKPKEILATNAQGRNLAETPKAEPKLNTVPVPPPVEPKNISAPVPTAVPAVPARLLDGGERRNALRHFRQDGHRSLGPVQMESAWAQSRNPYGATLAPDAAGFSGGEDRRAVNGSEK